MAGVQGSGFRVQDLEFHLYTKILNPEPRTLNPTNLTHLQQLSETKYPRVLPLDPAEGRPAWTTLPRAAVGLVRQVTCPPRKEFRRVWFI